MRCAVCYAFAADGATQCPHCGAPLVAPTTASKPSRLDGAPRGDAPDAAQGETQQTRDNLEQAGDAGPVASASFPSPPEPSVYPWQEGPSDLRGGAFQRLVTCAMSHVWRLLAYLVVLILLAIIVGRLSTLVDWILGLGAWGLAILSLARRGWRGLPRAIVAGIVGLVLVILGIRSLTTVGPPQSPSPRMTTPGVTARTLTLQMTGNVPWTDTGLDLTTGETVHIVASGTINNGSVFSQIATNSPAGQGLVTTSGGCTAAVTPQQGFLAPGLPCWSLIARVNSGAPFAVGTLDTLTIKTPGELWLGVNDNAFGNSAGVWTVTITVSRPV